MTLFDATTERASFVRKPRGEPPKGMLVVLYAREHARIGQRVALDDGLRLGRATEVFGDTPFEDPRMSRHHLAFYGVEAGYVVEDMGSTNGTFVNGRPVTRSALREEDVLQVGDTFLQYVVGAPESPSVPESLLIGHSPPIEALRKGIGVVAPTSTTVLVVGEPGVGKRTIGQEIHRLSGRTGPLVAVECAAGSPEEVEQQLFGRVQSGPVVEGHAMDGALARAEDGTLMLVDVDTLSPRAQVRLAWALDQLVRRTRAQASGQPRLVATARERPEVAADSETFRDDLYSRLVAWSVDIPPLCERLLDIGALTAWMADSFADTHSSRRLFAAPELMWAILEHSWPRNVPELFAVVQAACVEAMASDGVLRLTDRVAELLGRIEEPTRSDPVEPPPRSRSDLVRILRAEGLVVTRAARRYGKHRQQIYRWMRRFGVDLKDLREGAED